MGKLWKKIVFLGLLGFVIVLSGIIIYATYATEETQDNDMYSFTLTGKAMVTLNPLSSKVVYYRINNINKGTVSYGVGYSDIYGIIVRSWEGYNSSGFIMENNSVVVKLKVSNTTLEQKDVEISTILGYENGGQLIVPSGIRLVSSNRVIYNRNTLISVMGEQSSDSGFLGTSLKRSEIESISFVDDNIPSASSIASFDVCADDGRSDSIKLWYVNGKTEGLYSVYIGSDNGISSFSNGYQLFSGLLNVISMDLVYVDTSMITDMQLIFSDCVKLKSLDLSNFDTSNVTNMSGSFRNMGFDLLNLGSFDFDKVIDYGNMFYGISSSGSIVVKDCKQYDLLVGAVGINYNIINSSGDNSCSLS